MCRLAYQVIPAAVQLAYEPELDPQHENAGVVAYLGMLCVEDPAIAIRALSVATRNELHALVQGAPWDMDVEGDIQVLDAIAHLPQCDFEIAMHILDIYRAVDISRSIRKSFGQAVLSETTQLCLGFGLKIIGRVNADEFALSDEDCTTTPYWVQIYTARTEETPEFQLSKTMQERLKDHACAVFCRAVKDQAKNVVTLDRLTEWTWTDPPPKDADMATVMDNLVDMLDKAALSEASDTVA